MFGARPARTAIVSVALLCLVAGMHLSERQIMGETAEFSRKDTLILGFTRSTFAGVHIPDALAAMKVWASVIKKKRGLGGPVETRVFENMDAATAAVEECSVDLIILTTAEYLGIQCQKQLEPHYVHIKDGLVEEDSVLLVHRQSNISSLADLNNKTMIFLMDTRTSVGRVWLETELIHLGFEGLRHFFSEIKDVEKSSQAVLPVFFKQKDACYIHRSGFETISEMNPQIKRDLKIIASSPKTIPSITCIRKGYDPEIREILIDALGTLHLEPRGQQILMLFKVDGLAPFQRAYLKSTEDILARFAALR